MFQILKLPTMIHLGYQGEDNATVLEFDVSGWLTEYPGAVIGITYLRPDDPTGATPHPTPGVELNGSTLRWTVGAHALEVAGTGSAVIRCIVGGTEKHSAMIYTTVAAGHGPAGDVPEAMADYVAEVLEAGQVAKQDREAVEGLRTDYEGYLADTRQARDEAAGHEQRALAQGDRAEDEADRAEAEADEAEQSKIAAANNLLNGITTHDGNPASHPAIQEDIQRVEAIARGRATAHAFDTYQDMLDWLAVPENIADLVMGDNLYIRDTGVKDYWWDGEQPQELEAEAPDLTDYYTKEQVDALVPTTMTDSAYTALLNAGQTIAGKIYYTVPDGTPGV